MHLEVTQPRKAQYIHALALRSAMLIDDLFDWDFAKKYRCNVLHSDTLAGVLAACSAPL